jgi:hypothetical protein
MDHIAYPPQKIVLKAHICSMENVYPFHKFAFRTIPGMAPNVYLLVSQFLVYQDNILMVVHVLREAVQMGKFGITNLCNVSVLLVHIGMELSV